MILQVIIKLSKKIPQEKERKLYIYSKSNYVQSVYMLYDPINLDCPNKSSKHRMARFRAPFFTLGIATLGSCRLSLGGSGVVGHRLLSSKRGMVQRIEFFGAPNAWKNIQTYAAKLEKHTKIHNIWGKTWKKTCKTNNKYCNMSIFFTIKPGPCRTCSLVLLELHLEKHRKIQVQAANDPHAVEVAIRLQHIPGGLQSVLVALHLGGTPIGWPWMAIVSWSLLVSQLMKPSIFALSSLLFLGSSGL